MRGALMRGAALTAALRNLVCVAARALKLPATTTTAPWQLGEIIFPFFPILHPGGYVYRFIHGKEEESFDLEQPAFINAVCDLMQNRRICTMFNAADTDGSGGLSRDVRCSK